MCTNKGAQPEGHFQRLGGLLSNHPNQKKTTKLSNAKVHSRKKITVYHWARINLSIHSQKYDRCNQFHDSHVINSGELQECNRNGNCNGINLSESEHFFVRKQTARQTVHNCNGPVEVC